MVTFSPGAYASILKMTLLKQHISPFSSVFPSSILQAIAIFRSIAWISKMLLSAIKWIPEKIGVLGLEEIALLNCLDCFVKVSCFTGKNHVIQTSIFFIIAILI